MPVSTYQSLLGIAKDAVITTNTAALAVGATTVTIPGTNVPASYTLFFWDGPNSESKNVTAGGGTSTLTIGATTYAHPANTYITAQPTASIGPTDYIPVTGIDPEDDYGDLEDKGYRGSLVDVYNIVQGVASSSVTITGDVFADTIGYWLGGILGATDFTGGSPNTHAFSVKNTSDGQPTPFTLYDKVASINTRGYAGSKLAELAFKFSGDGLLTYSAKTVGYASGVVANPTASFSTLVPVAAWTGLVTIGGTAVSTLISGDLTIKRAESPLQTMDTTQHPYKIYPGAVAVEGKSTFVMEDDTQLLNMINNSQPSLDILFSTGAGASLTAVQFHLTKAAYKTGKPVRGSDYVQLDVSYAGVANTTDATTAGTGYSPIKATIKNTKATGTYQ